MQGQNQYDIAEVLQISQPTISRDVQYLRSKAKEEIKLHINEKLPEEYQRCLTGINQVLKIAWDIANKLPQDNRLKLQALSLANDCYKYKMDLLTNASVLSDAIKFVENSRNKLETVKSDIALRSDAGIILQVGIIKMTFKDLQRILQGTSVQLEQQTRLFNTLNGKEFWIWNSEQHRLEDIKTNGDCCFNHIIRLPKKNGIEKPLYDYQKLIFDNLQSHKYIWIKKATGLGITEFFLRYIAWLCLRNNEYQGSQICIVTGPNIDIAIKLIKRLKALFEERHQITFNNKETVLELNRCIIEAFPSNHLDSYRALDNPKFIFIDESDFFRKSEQEDVRHVSERYIAKSDPYIVMVSTPNAPDGLFEKIEKRTRRELLVQEIKIRLYLWSWENIH